MMKPHLVLSAIVDGIALMIALRPFVGMKNAHIALQRISDWILRTFVIAIVAMSHHHMEMGGKEID